MSQQAPQQSQAQPIPISLAKAKEGADAAVNWCERAFADRAAAKVCYAYGRVIRAAGYPLAAAPMVERAGVPPKVLELFTHEAERAVDALKRITDLATEVGISSERLAAIGAEEERRARGL